MKTPLLLLVLLTGTGLFNAACAKPVKPSKLFAYVGSQQIGGPMRVGQERHISRTPPKLPEIILETPELADASEAQPPPPPFDDMDVTAAPTVTSPVPPEADTYFEGAPAQTSALGALFQSIFQPPNTQPTSTGSATYRVVP